MAKNVKATISSATDGNRLSRGNNEASSGKLLAALLLGGVLSMLASVGLDALVPNLQRLGWIHRASVTSTCGSHAYKTELISLDPLVIYIHSFVSPTEADSIMAAGAAALEPSPVTGYGADSKSQARTSWSAPLPGQDPAVACVLERANSFMGTLMAPGRDEMGVAQMVRYTAGQKFDQHLDWFTRPRMKPGDEGRKRLYNRVATFFVILEANCTEGETYFPLIKPIAPQDRRPEEQQQDLVWRHHEDGGLAFKPIPGNAVFWVNIGQDGAGDKRVIHAGLPVKAGTKTAMNIWPRAFFGPDA